MRGGSKVHCREPLVEFMGAHSVFDLMATSNKVIVVDVRVPIKLAFFFLVEHGIRAAPVWDDVRHEVVGMLTPLDLVQILCFYFRTGSMDDALNTSQTIETWIDVRDRSDLAPPAALCCEPDMNLLQACRQFLSARGSGIWLPIMHPTIVPDDASAGGEGDRPGDAAAVAVASSEAVSTLPPVPPTGDGSAAVATVAVARASSDVSAGRIAMENRDDQTVLGVISLLTLLNYLVQHMAAPPGEREAAAVAAAAAAAAVAAAAAAAGAGAGVAVVDADADADADVDADADAEERDGGSSAPTASEEAAVAVADASAAASSSSSAAAAGIFDASLLELGICVDPAARVKEVTEAEAEYAVASDATLIVVLRLMLDQNISAVPVRNAEGAVDSIFSCDDVMVRNSLSPPHL